ncbi:MAG: serpin family protein [Methanoregula sp.]|jgi:serpin B
MRDLIFLSGFFAALIVVGIFIAGCVNDSPAIQPTNTEATTVVEANNRFAFDLYSNLITNPQNQNSNIFFSPFGISSALAITYEGARGTTADEIAAVFHFPRNDSLRRTQYAKIFDEMNQGDDGYTLKMANALWAEKNYPFLPGYTQLAQGFYRAKTSNLDFMLNPEDSRTTINRWVEEKTNDKITDLLPAGAIDESTRLVITNAIYFKGTWIVQFDPGNTKDANFTISPGNTVKVQMMQTDSYFKYAETENFQLLEMPYEHSGNNSVSMLVLLPKDNEWTSWDTSLDASKLAGLKNNLSNTRVEVYIPKFRIETRYSLSGTLGAMGMPVAFSDKADFSGMDGTTNLSIRDVIHKAYVNVDEEGTEATAATAVVVIEAVSTRPTPPVFRADHPFLFIIQDDDSGTILFMGRVMNPGAL